MTEAASNYPKVRYEDAVCTFHPVKVGISIFMIGAIALAIIAALIYTNHAFVGQPNNPAVCVGLSVTVGMFCIGATGIHKTSYNDVYPQGNWIDFIKRDWNDFMYDKNKRQE